MKRMQNDKQLGI